MKFFGATLVFIAELGMLAGLGRWAWLRAPGLWGGLLALGVCLVVAVAWGAFLSPKARWPIRSFVLTTAIRLALLLSGAAAAWFAGVEWLGGATALLAAVGTALAGRTAAERPPG
ncbi:MAG: DUF2568 domain-containing protein [Archangium sp.]|nr:DUF2568 domain-containing protein [Archangium sp.]